MTTTRTISATAHQILSDIESNPGCSKADLCRGLPNRTKAGRYGQIDKLITAGYVTATRDGSSYALAITALGMVA